MDRVEIEEWLWASRQLVLSTLRFGAGWWPMTNTTGAPDRQAQASAWALAFFLSAASSRCSGKALTAACHTRTTSETLSAYRSALMGAWLAKETAFTHSKHEVLVDFSVHNWNAANPVQLTGESEMYPSHGVGDQLTAGVDDYSWDFYKLLVVPSVTRLFVARVAGHGGKSASERAAALADTLVGLVDHYGPALLRHHDELGAVVLPAGKKSIGDTRILWLDRGRLRCDVAKSPPALDAEAAAANGG